VLFLKQKDESFESFSKFCKQVPNEKNQNIISVKSEHVEKLSTNP
jgi:hypothetical protein